MDVLSEVLKAVKLDGAVFFNGEFSTPWCAREPDSCTMATTYPSSRNTSLFSTLSLKAMHTSALSTTLDASRWSPETLWCCRTARRM